MGFEGVRDGDQTMREGGRGGGAGVGGGGGGRGVRVDGAQSGRADARKAQGGGTSPYRYSPCRSFVPARAVCEGLALITDTADGCIISIS